MTDQSKAPKPGTPERFDLVTDGYYSECRMEPRDDGDFIRWEDYEDLSAQLAESRKSSIAWKEQFRLMRKEYETKVDELTALREKLEESQHIQQGMREHVALLHKALKTLAEYSAITDPVSETQENQNDSESVS